jgi:hypothetical protein
MNFKPIKEISFPKGQSTSRNLNIRTKENQNIPQGNHREMVKKILSLYMEVGLTLSKICASPKEAAYVKQGAK